MEAHSNDFLKDVLVVLGATGLVIPFVQRLRVNPIFGFILVGVLVGPFGLGKLAAIWPQLSVIAVEESSAIRGLAELGVVFLMFMIGLELSWERLMNTRRLVFGLGLIQVVISALGLGFVLIGFGLDPSAAWIIGLALAMSSTAVIVQVLVAEKRLSSIAGRACFAVLLFQDLSVVPSLFVLGFLGNAQSGNPSMTDGVSIVLWAVGAVAAILAFGRWGLRPLFHLVAHAKSPESFMALSLLVVLTTGLITAYAGLSMELGALIAGLLLAETEYRRQIEVTIEPFKGLFLGAFLIAIGIGMDMGQLIQAPVMILGLCAGLITLKTLVLAPAARAFGLSWSVGIQAGLLLAPGGEFGFVILTIAHDHGLITDSALTTSLLVAALTLCMIPALSKLGQRVGPMTKSRQQRGEGGLDLPVNVDPGRVIIAGFGRVGRMVGRLLSTHNTPWVALDSDPDRVADAREKGLSVYFGDMTRIELLEKLDLDTARALVITVDDMLVTERLVVAARALRSDLIITVRARDARHAAKLYQLGASDAVPETVEASLQLAEAVLVDIGTPMGLVIASIHETRAEIQAETKAMAPQARERLSIRRRTTQRPV